MRQHAIVRLTEDQREHLTKITRSEVTATRVVTRAGIWLLADRSQNLRRTYLQIVEALQVSMPTVSAICQRFALGGLDAALYETLPNSTDGRNADL